LKTLKAIDPMSVAKVAAVLGIIWGLVVGIGIFVGLGIEQYMGRFYTGFGTLMPMVGMAVLIALPIGYGIAGFICGFIGALVYNFVAKQIGGIKVDLK